MKEQTSLSAVMKDISKKYGEGIAKYGAEDLTVDGILSLGSPTIDYCLYGGLPEGRIIELSGSEGSGKAQPLWSPVFTPNGYKPMGDIKVGDTVIDGKGNPTKVLGVFDRGQLPTYNVYFNDGTKTTCAGDHLWKIYNHSNGSPAKIQVLSTEELLQKNLHQGCWAYSVDVPIINIWEDEDIDIDPYLLGALIGDGSLSNNSSLSFSNREQDLIDKINTLLGQYNLTLCSYLGNKDYSIKEKDNCKYQYQYYFKDKIYYNLSQLKEAAKEEYFNLYKYINAYNKKDEEVLNQYSSEFTSNFKVIPNPAFNSRKKFLTLLEKYNLRVKSVDKHIPKNYLYSSYDTRVKLLQGLYDTDGYTDKNSNTSISTSSEQLCKDIEFLLRSLGCRVNTRITENPKYLYKYKDTEEIRYGNTSYEICFKYPNDLQVCSSEKHLKRFIFNQNKQNWWRSIVDIEPSEMEECRCIYVESDEHTYLTDDLICTHNTTTSFLIAASYQKEELKRNPENPRKIIFLDNEGTLDPLWAKVFNYDLSEDAPVQTIVLRPEGQNAEEIFDMALNLLRTGEVGLLIFDSIATLVPAQIADESMEKYQMGGIAKSLTRFANTALGLLRKYKATLVAINQVRENIGGYGSPLITPGGRSWKHACSSRLMFKRGDFFDEDGNKLTTSAESPAGHIVNVAVLKTKTSKWDRKVGSYRLHYTRGVDILSDTIEVAIHFGLIDNSVQGTFKILDPATGEIMKDEQGNEVKVRGKANLTSYFNEHLDLWKILYDAVYEKIRQKDSPYIESFEKMLNLNFDKDFGLQGISNVGEL